ncbi:MAG: ATP-binding protein [Spirochaetia bacterium]|jgi:signal transduction histidine kinase|nr:ATP-binding protein [Spirochaetia bacterium]
MITLRLRKESAFFIIAAAALIILLYVTQMRNYLLFHGIAEIFSIVIAFSIFIISWNGKKYYTDDYLLFIGISYLFIGFLDLLHTFGYSGMGVFKDYDFYANQLWIASRFIEAIALLIAFILVGKRIKIPVYLTLLIFVMVSTFTIYSIFFSDLFPVCFIPGNGLTKFKIYSEYLIIMLLVGSIYLVFHKRTLFSKDTYQLLMWSLVFTIISELSFTFYINNYGFSNMLGHYSKIISFYLIYKAIVVKSIQEPYNIIFQELRNNQKELQKSNDLKTTLFSIISHDLISPFLVVSSFVNLIENGPSDIPKEEFQEYMDSLKDSVESTSLLLDNLLNWAKLEMGGEKRHKESYLLKDLINKATLPLLPSYHKKKVSLQINVPESIQLYVNKDTFDIIVRNILSNALKFSFMNSTVEINALLEKNHLIISFKDHGTGMNINEVASSQTIGVTKRGTLNEKGSGLGLDLIKRYTKDNNGEMSIQSNIGEGTEISLKFAVSNNKNIN